MKLRLMGTEAECAAAVKLLRTLGPELDVVEVSTPYANRREGSLVRVYVDTRIRT